MWAVEFLALSVLIGLGTVMKAFTLFFFRSVIVFAIRSGRYRPLVVSVAGTALSWPPVNLQMTIMNFEA